MADNSWGGVTQIYQRSERIHITNLCWTYERLNHLTEKATKQHLTTANMFVHSRRILYEISQLNRCSFTERCTANAKTQWQILRRNLTCYHHCMTWIFNSVDGGCLSHVTGDRRGVTHPYWVLIKAGEGLTPTGGSIRELENAELIEYRVIDDLCTYLREKGDFSLGGEICSALITNNRELHTRLFPTFQSWTGEEL